MSEQQKHYHSKPIVTNIKSYYGLLKHLEDKVGILKDAIHINYTSHVVHLMEENEDFNPRQPVILSGMVMVEKPNVSYEYDPEIKQEAADLGFLNQIVKVKQKAEGFYNLEEYRTFQEQFIKPIPVGMKRKTEEEKELEAEKRQEKVDMFASLPFEELLSIYNEHNFQLKELKNQYDKDKELLLHAMTVDKVESFPIGEITFADENGNEQIVYHDGSYFKVMNNEMQYDNQKIQFVKVIDSDGTERYELNKIEKYELFLVERTENPKEYKVTDMLTGKISMVEENQQIPFDDVDLVIKDGILFVNAIPHEAFTKDENTYMGKREYTKILKAGGGLFRFSRKIFGEDFLLTCDVWGEGLDHLMTQSTINRSFVDQYKKKIIDPDKKNVFEVVTEEDYKKRLEMFSSIQSQKGQIRRMNEESRSYQ